jgi:hypothetical protein
MRFKIKYRNISGYKYQLVDDYVILTEIIAGAWENKYIYLTAGGLLTIKQGYAWDGPSGPAIDTKTFMRGSLVHDAIYQLGRQGLPELPWRDYADKLLIKITKEDGMCDVRCRWVLYAVRGFARRAWVSQNEENKIEVAP